MKKAMIVRGSETALPVATLSFSLTNSKSEIKALAIEVISFGLHNAGSPHDSDNIDSKILMSKTDNINQAMASITFQTINERTDFITGCVEVLINKDFGMIEIIDLDQFGTTNNEVKADG